VVTLSFSGSKAIVSGFLFALDSALFGIDTIPSTLEPSAPKKGAFKAQSQAIVHYLNHDGYILSRPN
jgi:hypothetical protein